MKPSQQTFRDFLDHGSRADTQTTYADGSKREPRFNPAAEEKSRRPLKPSPFTYRGTK